MTHDRFARLKELLLRAEGIPEEEREAYLDEACKDDPDLRREVERLLAADADPHPILETGAVVPDRPLDSSDGETLASFPTPQRIAGYRILEPIGEGGMGVVYKAEDTKLGRTVALKFLRSGSDPGDAAQARFRREARAAASLEHPNICTIYGIDEWEEQSFISMPFIDGTTLRERIVSGPLAMEETLDVALQMARGLQAAHEKGIVHRDIKPSNVMISSGGRVKIMDFGLARSGGQSRITKTGVRLGTVAYMSPEQTRGEEVDHRTDIWAFGVVLHEMLTGRSPFAGDSEEELQHEIVHGRAERVSESRPDVPVALEAIVHGCLAKKPEERPSDTGELVQVLTEVREGSSGPGVQGLLSSRRRRPWILAGAAAVLVATVAAVWLWQSRLGDGERPPGEPRFQKLTAFPQTRLQIQSSALSPDGSLLAVAVALPPDRFLDVVSVDTGERRRIVEDDSSQVMSVDWMPDGETLLCGEFQIPAPDPQHAREVIWLRNIVDGTSRRVFEGAWPLKAVLSPDGQQIAMLGGSEREIWVMDISGENRKKIRDVPEDEWVSNIAWSPDGTRVAYVRDYLGAKRTALETCDLQGEVNVVIEYQATFGLGKPCWLPDRRLAYILRSTAPSAPVNEVWSIPVDPTTGHPEGESRRIFSVEGAGLTGLRASRDGRRLSFHKSESVQRMRLLELGEEGDSIRVGRVASQNWPGRPHAWTRDGKRLFYTVERTRGDTDIYVRNFQAETETPFFQTDQSERAQCLTPDGRHLLFLQRRVLRRIPVDGGPAEDILELPESGLFWRVLCATAPGSLCVSGRVEGSQIVFQEISLRNGTLGDELARVDLSDVALYTVSGGYDLSPDGTRIVIVEMTGQGSVRVLNLLDGSLQEIDRDWGGGPQTVSWFGDGASLCMSGMRGGAVYWVRRVGLDGSSSFLWRSSDQWAVYPVPSPDGSRIAFRTGSSVRDVWMVEGF